MTDEIMREFAHRLRQIRERRGLSLAAAAKLVDNEITSVSINRFETGNRFPSLPSLIQLARAYDIDIIVNRDGTLSFRGSGIKQLDHDPITGGTP